jgi:hypothetical protein
MAMKHKLRSTTAGFVLYEAILALGILIIVGLTGYFILHGLHATAKTAPTSTSKAATTPSANSYAVLSPATVPSKVPECAAPISFQSNGNSGPVQCSSGDLNATEWNALAALEPSVMSLGYSATSAQVQNALCADASASSSDANTKNSNVVETTVYQITALYYGWNFASNPSAVLTNGTC